MNAIRRHHHERLRKKRLKRTSWPVERVGMYIDTPTPCSRACCGNPRKWFRQVTRKEQQRTLEFELAAWEDAENHAALVDGCFYEDEESVWDWVDCCELLESMDTDSAIETMLLSEGVLAKEWNTPEEDEAWKCLNDPGTRLQASIDELESGGGQRFDTMEAMTEFLESCDEDEEDEAIVQSGILPKLIEQALTQAPSKDWRKGLEGI